MKKFILCCLLFGATQFVFAQKTIINVDFSKEIGEMRPFWAWFGADEPNYAYMKDGKKLLSELSAMSPVPVYFRAHNLLTSGHDTMNLKWGSTNIYTEDAQGNPVYDFTIVDKIFDTYLQRGIKPMAQFSFMPEALSTNPQPYEHHWQPGMPYDKVYTGWAYPPKDYKKWADLVYTWVKHAVARYGKAEVESWYWELWNEPNIGYWKGTVEEYCKLYDYTADAAKRALPTIKIGGPETTGPSWNKAADFLKTFLNHCISGKNYVTGKVGSPLDFITFHAKGSPKIVDGHVQMNMGTQLRDISEGFRIVASYPTLKHLPIIIGESDPEGCAACGMKTNPQNAYRNGTMYSSYTAASFARKYALADYFKVNLKGVVSWSFEFENQPYFYGFRDLATNGIDKPVLNVFRMFALMSGKRVAVSGNQKYTYAMVRDSSVRGKNADIDALASKDLNSAAVMLWHYHDDDVRTEDAAIELNLKGFTAKTLNVHHYRIDDENSNAYEVWKKMGSPENPSAEQIAILEKAGQLTLLSSPSYVKTSNGSLKMNVQLPRQGVSLLKFDW
ncbi:GH39 family glycosyl hydrolase [Haliscomenobacter hydrossis]|uniref:Xylan 1,4-beta-xylosidase n=1 Tax=Haliscomenobacter hydrossis (strain ATCC 27775 / DSM 1100 / LMG 10767 / O) TaxID=760192 RepID=F4L618_HALH1|nr:beta-xylosidase [Haliscomenobacter hydrossis]AEE53078.1 Xylan 1,4-beta-xylosidase [Haliscomenobacter hydrossis DSM 1100]